jgi:hypothetical protein
MAQQPGSPLSMTSNLSTPASTARRGGLLSLSPFKRTVSGSPGADGGGFGGGRSPQGSEGGGGGQRSLIPSYSHAVQKREIIRAQEEQLAALRGEAQRQVAEVGRCVGRAG